ncbi:MAG: 8-oxo-dGTP pyrophosphatase MutT (NUDIX family) [Halioglobus sp.]
MKPLIEFDDESGPILPAATVVLMRDGCEGVEALLVQRSKAVKHMGGMWVFPGGKVDEEDRAEGSDDYRAAVNAAIRETQEEAGLVISADQLVYLSHWTTPEGAKKRFATWFFLAILHRDQQVKVDGGEISAHRWICPHRAFAESNDAREKLRLMPPTYISLIDIAAYNDCHEAQQAIGVRQAIVYAPRVVTVEGGMCFLYGGDAGYRDSNPAAQGVRHRAYMVNGQMEYQRD